MASLMPDTVTAMRTCQKCGATILPHETGVSCGACFLETALGPITDGSEGDTNSVAGPVLIEFGDYELLEELGRGGQGVVYRARQKSLNRIVALKVIGLGQWAATAHVKRFRQEAEAAARLEHPGIVPIYEVGEREGSCFFSMKFVDGGQLDAVIKREPMSPRQSVELLAKIARTVQFAHERGILHRDIKPGNILLDGKGEPQLTDFGLARLIEQQSTVTNSSDVLGTPSYMSPEQAGGHAKELTAAADVYGLGAVLYQLLTSHPPFAGGTTYETIRQVLETDARRPRLWNAKVDRDIETICLKCLEKDPQKRYPTALALAEDLEHWLRHEPVRARRTGVFSRGRKWIRRNPTTAVLGPLLAALVTALIVIFWKVDPGPPPTGIAVLPFENLSDNKEEAFFADGMQDDILTKLAKVADLKVISRTSVMQYRGERNMRKIGQVLRVSHVLEGSVRKVDGRIRVNAQLIDTRTDAHLWAETYERARADLFGLESELAQQVAARLSTKVSRAEKSAIEERPTQDVEAYEFYARARQLIGSWSVMDPDPMANAMAAVELLEKAVGRDPNFALAWCALAEAALNLYWVADKPPEWLAKAGAAVERAAQLAPNAGETHLTQALFFYRKLDFDRALEELEVAARLLPNSAQVFQVSSWIERRMGRWRESLRHCAKAVELDPRNIPQREDLLRDLSFVRRHAEVVRLADQAIADFPDKADHFRLQKADALLSIGDLKGARSMLESLSPDSAITADSFLTWFGLLLYERNYPEAERSVARRAELVHHEFLVPDVCFSGFVARAQNDASKTAETFTACREQLEANLRERPNTGLWISMLGLADAALGRREAAIDEVMRGWEATDGLKRSWIPLDRANVYCWLGERDRAFEEMEKAVKKEIGGMYGDLRFNPCWDSLRDDPRFEKILAEAAKPLPLQ